MQGLGGNGQDFDVDRDLYPGLVWRGVRKVSVAAG